MRKRERKKTQISMYNRGNSPAAVSSAIQLSEQQQSSSKAAVTQIYLHSRGSKANTHKRLYAFAPVKQVNLALIDR